MVERLSNKKRPALRGVSHLLAFIVSLYTGWVMVSSAPEGTKIPVVLYACGISFCFGASALLHIPTYTSFNVYRNVRKLDHSMVFFLIATTYNAISILPDGGRAIIWIGWIGATLGILSKVLFFDLVEKGPKSVTSLPYIVLGWCCLWELQRAEYYVSFIGWEGIGLCALGGFAVTAGALCYTFKRPNPIPGVFGHHEILHLGVVIAIYCFYFAFNMILHEYPRLVQQQMNQ